MDSYEVVYTEYVVDFMLNNITSERVYNKIDEYRTILELFPDIGHIYDPIYPAARLLFPCWFIPVPNTPFTLYYVKDDTARRVLVFYMEYQVQDPRERFEDLDMQ